MDESIEQSIAYVGTLVRRAERVIALTGAGVSTPSGIPDFRSPGSGLWEYDDPTVVASLSSFTRDPRPFFDWIRPLAVRARDARPNPAHVALAELETAGKLRAVITQNIDGLHQEAGSRSVLELHGSLRTATCTVCGDTVDGLAAIIRDDPPVPLCSCGGVYKPDIVFFEEVLPADVLMQAQEEAQVCDVVIVAGSSLEVMPAGRIPLLALRAGAALIIVNHAPTPYDRLADAVIRDDVAEILPRIATWALLGTSDREE